MRATCFACGGELINTSEFSDPMECGDCGRSADKPLDQFEVRVKYDQAILMFTEALAQAAAAEHFTTRFLRGASAEASDREVASTLLRVLTERLDPFMIENAAAEAIEASRKARGY